MQILIDNKPAAIKQGSTFDFVAENRYFSGADSYTLAITFPLKDCPQNLAIFGHINRKDVLTQQILFDCEIRHGAFYRHGSITITEISDIEVKTQFLEGKSVSNYDNTFDDIYINELELGYPNTDPSSFSAGAHIGHSIDDGLNYLALPWVNNSTGNVQNRPNDSNSWPSSWYYDTRGLSFQPYLIYLLKQICNALGYSYDFSRLMNSQYKFLIVCNTLPYAWNCRNWATALPHWTITEFFEQLEYFLNGEFDIDHAGRTISFRFSKEAIESAGVVKLENIVNEFSSAVEDGSSCKYRESVNLKFAECNHRKWNYYSCKWFVDMMKTQDVILSWSLGTYNYGKFYKEVNGAQRLYIELAGAADYVQEEYSGWSPSYLYYCRAEQTYFVLRNYGSYLVDPSQPENLSGNKRYLNTLEPVNMFGDSIVNESGETVEIKIVPVWIDEAYADGNFKGNAFFLECGEYRNGANGTIPWDFADKKLTEGDSGKSVEYFDKLYMGFWSGTTYNAMYGKYTFPVIDHVLTYPREMNFELTGFSMRLRTNLFGTNNGTYQIDNTKKYTFKFLADDIPNVRSLFIIQGQRFICEKITATFGENGMSQLLKGVFYPVVS
ncbi:MAG: hypothetical protein J5621_01255 [Paludibacteraceae bacterium]|nr:hypothetical protein [Paludibacteraceae bacterium]